MSELRTSTNRLTPGAHIAPFGSDDAGTGTRRQLNTEKSKYEVLEHVVGELLCLEQGGVKTESN